MWSDTVSVINAANPESILATDTLTSRDLLLARIPVGLPDRQDGPRDLAATSNANRAYVALEQSGSVALVDLMMLRQVDTNPQTAGIIEPIDLRSNEPNAMPRSIVIGANDSYAYVGDSQIGNIYVVDINPNSTTYNQLVQTINVGTLGVRQLAISSDGKKLFATTKGGSSSNTGQIFVINIDLQDRPQNWLNNPNNPRSWHKLIGTIPTAEVGTEGITATNDPLKMIFTRTGFDATGFGVLTITNNDPTQFNATVTKYVPVGLGSFQDYFDVNDVTAATITSDGRYAFVAGFNGKNFGLGASIDEPRAGSNVGIIKDPLTDRAQLVAATRPIPNGWTNDLVLSGDDKYLTAVYPGVGSVFMFDVEEIIRTIENPNGDLTSTPIDEINPNISIAADLKPLTTQGNQINFGVPEGSNRAPLAIGNNPWSITTVSKPLKVEAETKYLIDRNILNYNGVPDAKIVIQQQVTNSLGNGLIYGEAVTNNLVATLPPIAETERLIGLPSLVIDAAKDLVLVGEEVLTKGGGTIGIPTANIGFAVLGIVLAIAIAEEIRTSEITLTISTFPEGEGLGVTDNDFIQRPSSAPEEELYTQRNGVRDYNPNRVFTLTWKLIDQINNLGQWYINGRLMSPELLPRDQVAIDALNLTAGQKYYWQGEYISGLTGVRGKIEGGEFTIPQHQPLTDINKTFSSVTVITPDSNVRVGDLVGREKALEIAKGIARNFDGQGDNGTILVYDPTQNQWIAPLPEYSSLTNLTPNKFGAPLILIDDWSLSSSYFSTGFAEASADNFFAALVRLNQSYSGDQSNALFNSPFHFIGHGRGAVVNSEIIQRLGTFYPQDRYGEMFPDLQMTTIDPHDFAQNGINYYDPAVQVWNNVTFADNYYQTNSYLQHQGRELENTIPDGWFQIPESNISRADLNVELNARSGFNQENFGLNQDPHKNTLAWYAGTADVSLDGINSPFATQILRRKGDFSRDAFNDGAGTYLPWYTNDLTQDNPTSTNLTPVPLGDENGQWEGIGTGWYYSAIGGGYSRRNQLPVIDTPQTPIGVDNTVLAQMRGDFAVPTLFNGNFDAVRTPRATDPIPGWVFEGATNAGQNRLKTWAEFLPPNSPARTTYNTSINNNYALELHSGESLVHNNFVVPDWGFLRFDLHASNPQGGTVQVSIKGDNPNDTWQPLEVIVGRNNDGTVITSNAVTLLEGDYSSSDPLLHDPNQLAYALDGFETFQFDIPEYLRGKSASIKFAVDRSTNIYLDNIFFKSKHLMLGNPTLTDSLDGAAQQEARFNPTTQPNNYLVERPQYSLSYNNREKGPNWVSYQLNNSWVGSLARAGDSWSPDYMLLDPLVKTDTSQYFSPEDTPTGGPYQLHRGHMATRSHRNRNLKDQQSTFYTSSMLPQHMDNNSDYFRSAWFNFENYIKSELVIGENKEVYIISGGIGSASNLSDYINNPPYKPNEPFPQSGINYPEGTWKVAVVLDPGQTIADITRSTRVIAIITPNERVPSDLTPDELAAWRNWRNWRVSVDDIEAETGLDLLSNIPTQIQDYLESRVDVSSALMAEENSIIFSSRLLFHPSGFIKESAVFPKSSIEKGSGIERKQVGSTSEIISYQNNFRIHNRHIVNTNTDPVEVSLIKNSGSQDSLLQTGMREVGSGANSSTQISLAQIGMSQVNVGQVSSDQVSSAQISVSEIGAAQIDTHQIRSTQINIPQVGIFYGYSTNTDSSKITFPSRVSSQQSFFFNQFSLSSHNPQLQLTNIYSTAQTLWQTATPINLNFEITNLPAGQLAEATITDYNSNGTPSSATISIDDDANGIGWFIDSTPWDSSEFNTTLTSTAYKATTG